MSYPENIGECADLLHAVKSDRLARQRECDEVARYEAGLNEHIVSQLSKSDLTGASGQTHTVRVVTKEKPRVNDWPAFFAEVARLGRFDMLQKRVSDTAVLDTLANGVKLPGVETFNLVSVSLTKR